MAEEEVAAAAALGAEVSSLKYVSSHYSKEVAVILTDKSK